MLIPNSQFILPLLSPLLIYFSRRVLGNLNTIFEWQYNEMKIFLNKSYKIEGPGINKELRGGKMMTWKDLGQRLQTLQAPGRPQRCANQDLFKTIERYLKCIYILHVDIFIPKAI